MKEQHFSQRISLLMSRLGLNQKELARQLGISQPAVSLYLKGRMPPADVIFRLARLANTSMEWILTGEQKPEPEGAGTSRAATAVHETAPVYGSRAELLHLWQQLPEPIRQDLLALMRHLNEIYGGEG